MANKNISKPNDMLISTLVNGEVSTMDLLLNGINAGNTQFLDPESYKETKLIKEKFTDEKGNFREDIFNEYYIKAAKLYEDLAEMNTYKKLEDYIEYNAKDIFAPLDAKRTIPGYEIQKEKNPLRRSHGIDSLFEYGRQTKSLRELAQMSKIWDSEKGEWMDKTANDRGILGSLFGQSLVYATYDEDTETIDPITGRKIKHKKGEWKLNEDGQYYTETIGNRSGYGKQFVAASDTLTKEDSTLNKIDFFDSDDIEKSTVGTVMKTAVKILPYLLPQTRMIWGGATAVLEMAKVMPTFAKMIEGIAIGGNADNETAFTRSMSLWENYFSKFEDSYSDVGTKSNWSGEKMLNIVSDIFAQLYQMRAAASLSRLAVKDPSRKAVEKLQKDLLPRYIQEGLTKNSGLDISNPKTMQEIISLSISKMPEVKAVLEKQSKLSKALSVGYMALSSSADVYSDALAGGYDRRMAGAAGLAAVLGQYGIMTAESKLNLGGWLLDESVGYSEGVQRQTMLKALRPYYDEILEEVKKLDVAPSKTEKIGIVQKMLGKILPSIKKTRLGIKDGGLYLKDGLTEAIQEVTEEAVMDSTKGIFDFLSYVGVGSNKNASFGVVEDFTSGSFLERYLQNAVGGFMGGMLFEFQQNKIEPWMNRVMYGKIKEDVLPSLIHEIANGHVLDLYNAVDELAELDSDIAAIPIDISGDKYAISTKNQQLTRGQATAQVLKDYIRTLEGVMIGENANLTDDQLLEKSIRDYQAISILKKNGLDKLLIADFTKLSSDVASIRLALDDAEKKDENKSEELKKSDKKKLPEEFDDGVYEGKSVDFLIKLLTEKRKELSKFLNGEKAEFYTYKTLVGATPEIKTALGDLSIFDYTFLKYGKEFKDLKKSTGTINQDSVTKEWEAWKDNSNADEKFIKLGVEAYADFEKRFAKFITDYASSGYGNVRKITMAKLLSSGNLDINEILDNDSSYNSIKKLANLLKEEKTGNITLQDIFSQDELLLNKEVTDIINRNSRLVSFASLFNIDKGTIISGLSTFLQLELGAYNVDNLSGTALEAVVESWIQRFIELQIDKIPTKEESISLQTVQDFLIHNGLLTLTYNPNSEELIKVTDKSDLANFITSNIKVASLSDISLGLGTSLLSKYITSENTIDGTVKQRVSQEALRNIIKNILDNEEYIRSSAEKLVKLESIEGDLTPILSVSSQDLKKLVDTINNNFDGDLDQILDDWVKEISDSFIKLIDFLSVYTTEDSILPIEKVTSENIQKGLIDIIKPLIQNDKIFNLYTQIKNKLIKENSIYESLSNIDLLLSQSGRSKVLEILQQLHDKLRAVERFEDYLPQVETKIQLENALRAINLYKALVLGMTDGAVGLGTPFAVNQQMKRFLEVNKLTSDRTYETIDEDSADLIFNDLQIIENQIKGYLLLRERAYTGKTQLDANIKKQYCKLLVDTINSKAEAFTINDFSLLPPQDEREKYGNNPEASLIFYAHEIYSRFNKKFTSDDAKRDAIRILIQNLKLNPESINRGSKPQNLNRELFAIEDFDLIMWLATSLGADTNEFYYRYNRLIVGEESDQNIPLFSQEIAALLAWSFLRDDANVKGKSGNISVHDAFIEELIALNPNLLGLPSSRLFFINGITGAGKTTVVGSILSRLNSDRLIQVTAVNKKQVENYSKSIKRYNKTVRSGSIESFMGNFFTPDNKSKVLGLIKSIQTSATLNDYYSKYQEDSLFKNHTVTVKNSKGVEEKNDFAKLDEAVLQSLLNSKVDISTIPEVLFIDEATLVPQPTLQILNFLAHKYNFKIILSGDSVQRGARLDQDTQAFNDLFMWKSAKLNVSVRSSNNQIANNNYEFNKLLEQYEVFNITDPSTSQAEFKQYIANPVNQIAIAYFQNADTFTGYKFVEDLSKHQEDINLIADLNKAENEITHSSQKIMVITKLNADSKPVDTSIETLLSQAELQKNEDYEFFSPDDIHDKAVQGSEARYVIIDKGSLSNNSDTEPGEVLRSVYTFASRAQVGALMVLSNTDQDNIGIRNREDRFTQPDELPQLADRTKLKNTRKEELATILGKYEPKDIDLANLKSIKKEEKEEFVRSTTVPKTTLEKPVKKKAEVIGVRSVDPENETQYDEESQEILLDTLNTEISEEIPVLTLNDATGTTTFIKKHDPTTSVRMYPSMNHVGLLKDGRMFIQRHSGINLDLDGLFDPNRRVNEAAYKGFLRFLHLLVAAKSKEDIVIGILNDRYIGYFLSEAVPSIAINLGLESALKEWKTSDALCNLYSDWFDLNVTIDLNYYIFAKKLNWDTDKPTTIANPDINKSVGQDNTVLYYGVKLSSNDGLLNLYISIGTMSNKVTPDGNPIESQELLELYRQADEDLMNEDFIAYSLPNTNLYNLDITSTLGIRNTKTEDDNINWGKFEPVSKMRERGFDIDVDHMYLIDRTKVQINGRTTYKAIALLAAIGNTHSDLNDYFTKNKISFEERIKKLENLYVDNQTGDLKIAGSYLTFARYVGEEVIVNDSIRSSAFNRIVFLNPKRNTAAEVFNSENLKYHVVNDKKSEVIDQRSKLALTRPSSLKKLIISILSQAKAFDDVNLLKKYLIGIRTALYKSTKQTDFSEDKKTINTLIEYLDTSYSRMPDNSIVVDPVKFAETFAGLLHRILFYPFFTQFCYPNNNGNGWIFRNLVNKGEIVGDTGLETLKFDKKDTHGDIILNLDVLPESYTCLPLARNSGRVDVLEGFDIQLPEGITLGENDNFDMLQISYNDQSGEYIGMYGYQLLDPTFQILNNQLSNFEKVPDRLVQVAKIPVVDPNTGETHLVDPRYPQRSSYLEVHSRPNTFNPDDYRPVQLKASDYIVDKDIEQFVHTKSDKKKIVGYKSKPVKNKQGKWTTEYIKDKKGKRIPIYEQIFLGDYGITSKSGKYLSLTKTNSMGFEVRPGDYVQLWGYTDEEYYVERLNVLDPNDIKIVVSYVGSAVNVKLNMRPLSEDLRGKEISIEGVTKVVKRTIPEDSGKYRKNDVYTTGEFGVKLKFESGKYALIIKTSETMEEMIDAVLEDDTFIKSLNFNPKNGNFYLFKPLTKELLESGSLSNDPAGSYIVDSILELKKKHDEYTSDEHPEIVGYTLFQIFRKEGYNNEARALSLIDQMRESISQAAYSGQVSDFILHKVIFDESVVEALNQDKIAAYTSNVSYNPIEIAESLPKPEELLILNDDGTVNVSKTSAVKPEGIKLIPQLFTDSWNKEGKYPANKWMYRQYKDANNEFWYMLYPRPEFIFQYSKAENGKRVYDLNTDSPTATTYLNYDRFIISGLSDFNDMISIWKNRLVGFQFNDYQFDAFETPNKIINGKPLSNDEYNQLKNQKIVQRSKLIKSGDTGYFANKVAQFIITGIGHDNGDFLVYYAFPDNNGSYDAGNIKSVPLKYFISQLGTRFLLLSLPRLNIGTITDFTKSHTSIKAEPVTDNKVEEVKIEKPVDDKQSILIKAINITEDFIKELTGNANSIKAKTYVKILENLHRISRYINNLNGLVKINFDENLCKTLVQNNIPGWQYVLQYVSQIDLDYNPDTDRLRLAHALMVSPNLLVITKEDLKPLMRLNEKSESRKKEIIDNFILKLVGTDIINNIIGC